MTGVNCVSFLVYSQTIGIQFKLVMTIVGEGVFVEGRLGGVKNVKLMCQYLSIFLLMTFPQLPVCLQL